MIEHKGQRLLTDQGEGNMDTCERGYLCYRVWLIVKANDDRISAARYAMMMKRFATRRPVKRVISTGSVVGAGSWMG